jgi:YidC/Oxa1 family membrane protein insertase
MKAYTQNKTQKLLTRLLLAVMLLAILGCSMTACASGGAKITTVTKQGSISVPAGNKISDMSLNAIADAIVKSKSGAEIREQLVAAVNGYDMTAADFDDAMVADGTLAAQPEKAAEFALNVLKKANIIPAANTIPEAQYGDFTADDAMRLVNCFQTKVETEANLGTFDQILHWIGIGFGWLIEVPGFGSFILGTVYFAILLELLMLPLGIHQQKNSRKQAKLRPKEMAIRNKYKGRNDQATMQKLNQEIQELYTKEGYSPMAGCLPMLLTLPFLFALYYIVIDPMTYIFGAPTGLTSAFLTFADAPVAAGGLGLGLGSNRGTIEVLSLIREQGLSLDSFASFQYFSNSGECLSALSGLSDSIPNFSLFGMNMGLTAGFGSKAQLMLLFMPVLTFLVYFASGRINRKFSFQPMQQAAEGQKDPSQGCSNFMMDIMMPGMSAYFTFIMPAAVGLYWMFKSILGTVKQIVLFKAMPMPTFTEEDYKAAERELMGKEPKNKPARVADGTRNPNVRSLHHIDDEDYESPAEREARLAARKADYVEPEDETPAAPKTADGAFGGGATLKEDDRPARKDKKSKTDEDN